MWHSYALSKAKEHFIKTYLFYCIGRDANLDEYCQAVVGVASCVQVVLVLLGDVRHQHIHQSLHRMVEGCRETLVPGQLD